VKIELFQMERSQCLLENVVRYNLSESGVAPLRVAELLGEDCDAASLLDTKLGYPWAGGSPELREAIADFYPGASGANVRVTNGSSEAIFMACWGLLERRDHAAIQLPNYLQAWGLARHFAGRAEAYRLVERPRERRWELDLDSLARAVTRRTRLVLVTHPNNPTGHVLSEAEMDAIVAAARRADAWIVSDEVYRGAELTGGTTPSFFGRYRKVLVTSGLSKAFGLAGLRSGWLVGPPKMVERLERYHDYTTLTPTMLSERLARLAMAPARREQLLARTRQIVGTQWPRLRAWIESHDGALDAVPPLAGAIALIRYRQPIGATALFERLHRERSVLVTPGAHFGIRGRYFRVGYGYDIEHTLKGLGQVSELLAEVDSPRARSRRTPKSRPE
jgi:aspartate/methionine/tyrosine aminotransferase